MRTAFINQLMEEARKDRSIFLLTGDLGFSVLEPFAKEFPERFVNVGIAEQNMAGIAAGLALDGWNVFTYSIANFPTLRSLEQIRYDICYHDLNVTVVSGRRGLCIRRARRIASCDRRHCDHARDPEYGGRIPGRSDRSETDHVRAREAQRPELFAAWKGGGADRSSRTLKETPVGRALEVRKGKGTVILACGSILKYADTFLKEHRPDFGLYSFPFVKPIDKELLAKIAFEYAHVITLEEHQKSGGFGSAVLEAYNDLLEEGKIKMLPNIKRVAIPDIFLHVAGTQEYLRKIAGLEEELKKDAGA